MRSALLVVAVVAVLGVCLPSPGGAAEGGAGGLLIAPTRVELGPRQRSAELTLMNRGTGMGTYRLSLVERRMTEDGRLEALPEGQQAPASAAAMVRFSPRQVRLEPGASQKVRLLVRRPASLEAGEYRSHLLIQTLPEPGAAPERRDGDGGAPLQVRLVTMTAVSIPVIVRHGAVSATAAISDLSLVPAGPEGGPPVLRFRLLRDGSASTYGDVEVTYRPAAGGEVRELGRLRGVAVYTPNRGRWVEVPLPGGAEDLGAGVVRVAYSLPNPNGSPPMAVAELARD